MIYICLIDIVYKTYYIDFENDLYYLKSRYYNPSWGRFISSDKIEFLDPSVASGLNLYAYCLNNPVMCDDPEGKSTWKSFWELALKVVIVVGEASIVSNFIGLPFGDALLATAGVNIVINHINNAIIINDVEKEVENMTEVEIDELLKKYNISISENNIKTTDKNVGLSKKERLKVLAAIKKKKMGLKTHCMRCRQSGERMM